MNIGEHETSGGVELPLDTGATWLEHQTSDSDEELIGRWRTGDEDAFEQLFLRYYRPIYRVLYGLTHDAHEAEDLAQETFVMLYRQPPRLQAGSALGAWLYRVAANRGFNALRSARRAQQRLERAGLTDDTIEPDAELLRHEERARVRAVLGSLAERDAKLLVLRNAGLSYAEMAAALQIAPGSVGTFLVRAERAFIKSYERLGGADHGD